MGADGQVFIAKGINIQPNQAGISTILDKFPGLNAMRIPTSPSADQEALTTFVDSVVARGVVVIIEDHTSSGGNPNTSSGQALADECSWYKRLATKYLNNPLVWFGTANEPNNTSHLEEIPQQELAIYNAIRSTGSSTIVALELRGGGYVDSTLQFAGYFSAMTLVVWDCHFYGYLTGDYPTRGSGPYSTDNPTVVNALNTQIARLQTVRSADGVVPVIVGEFGPSTSGLGTSKDANGTQVVQAVLSRGQGFCAWAWDAGSDNLTSRGKLTEFGRQVARRIAAQRPPQPPQR